MGRSRRRLGGWRLIGNYQLVACCIMLCCVLFCRRALDSGDDDGVGEDYDDDDYDNDLKQDDLGLSEYEWWWRGTMSMPVELGRH